MTKDELIAAVPISEHQGHHYVRVDDVPMPWREQFEVALHGSAFRAVPGESCICAYPHDWLAWVNDRWSGRPGPIGLSK
ncbi:MAG: hypothetical protein C0423_05765 [Methylibium sp.]|nr:hypothetical protein [Methylibium sp.]